MATETKSLSDLGGAISEKGGDAVQQMKPVYTQKLDKLGRA